MTRSPRARNFPIRNRIISGLARCLLVMEAGEKSGALITSGFALNYKRPVFTIPGNLDQPTFAGNNRWLQQGMAQMAREAADLLPALRGRKSAPPAQMDWLAPVESPPAGREQQAPVKTLTGVQGAIQEALRKGPLHPDDLSHELDLPVEKLLGLLLELELSGDLVQTVDNLYALGP